MSTLLLACILLAILLVVGIVYHIWSVARLRRELDEVREDSRRRLAKLQREQNNRIKRLKRELDEAERTGHLEFATELLPALDSLREALRESREDSDVESLREGLEMVDRQVATLLERHDIEEIAPGADDPFDPEVHEALRVVDPDEIEPGSVVHCHRPGYRFDNRVLRSASVDVAVGARSKPSEDDPGEEEPTDEAAESEVRVERDESAEETSDGSS